MNQSVSSKLKRISDHSDMLTETMLVIEYPCMRTRLQRKAENPSDIVTVQNSSTAIEQHTTTTTTVIGNGGGGEDSIKKVSSKSKRITRSSQELSLLEIALNSDDPFSNEISDESNGTGSATKDVVPFRGFVTLLGYFLFFFVLETFYSNHRKRGFILGGALFSDMMNDIIVFWLVDAAMLLATFYGVFLEKCFMKGIIKDTGIVASVLRHTLNSLIVLGPVIISFKRKWKWMQAGSIVMHSITMYMKVYSYLEVRFKERNERHDGKVREASFKDFGIFLITPSLIYKSSFQRTNHIRLNYLLKKAGGCFFAMLLLYICIEHRISPILRISSKISLWESIVQLMVPFTSSYLLLFYIIFEAFLPFMAEVSCTKNRIFYEDWWNAATFEEMARKWNVPVHYWLLEHVYKPHTNLIGKNGAIFLTFLFSSILHEFILAVTGGRIRMEFFIMQMCQIPLIYMGRLKWVQSHRSFGNAFFWGGMLLGLPLTSVLYSRDQALFANIPIIEVFD